MTATRTVTLPLLSLMFLVVVLFSTTAGVSHGLNATSAQDAEIERGEDYNLSTNETRQEQFKNATSPGFVPEDRLPGPLQPVETSNDRIETFAEDFAHSIVILAMEWAAAVAVFTYHNSWWIKEWWAGPLIQLVGLIAVSAVLGHHLSLCRQMVKRSR